MRDAVKMVTEFHRHVGAPINAGLNSRVFLRFDLIAEEFRELRESFEASGTFDVDRVGAADALADLCYVVIGAAVEWGIPLAEVFAEVHRSNMTKTPGIERADGKIQKGPDFRQPRIGAVLDGKLCGFHGQEKAFGSCPHCVATNPSLFAEAVFGIAPRAPKHDPVNHPSHYVAGQYECLDVIEALGLGYALGNAMKYLWRAGKKGNAVEDLKKARFYIDREIKRLEAEG